MQRNDMHKRLEEPHAKNGHEKVVDVQVKEEYDSLRIYINDFLHISIKIKNILGVHTWIEGEGNKFCIEYTLPGVKTIKTEYYRRDLWENILKGLRKISII